MSAADDLAKIKERIAKARQKAQEIKLAHEREKAAEEAAKAEAAQEAPEVPESKGDDFSVYVGSVDYSVRKEELAEFFSACGEIKRCTIIADHYTHKPKGYAYIEFSDMDGVENALKLNDQLLKGRQLVVRKKRENKPNMHRSRGPRRHFRRQ